VKKRLLIIGLALPILLFGVGYRNQSQAYTTVNFSLFFDALAPYGNWIPTMDYGYIWQPADTGADWRPYTDGQWVWTDDGWTWVSYEPWGWATYHYGRWVFTDDYGWVWIPDTVWAPAWVTWYEGSDYIGWAPLPPDNSFFLQIGIEPTDYNYYVQPRYCVFVPSSSFLYSNISSVVVPSSRNITIIRNTTNINNITVVNNRVINRGPSVGFVENATRVRVQKMNIVERDADIGTIVRSGTNSDKIEGRNLYVLRPNLTKKAHDTPSFSKGMFEGNTLKIKNRGEIIQSQGNLQNAANPGYPIFKRYAERNAVNNRDERVLTQSNPQNITNQSYPAFKGNSVENPFVRRNRAQFQYTNIQAENRYPLYRNAEGQFSRGSTRNTGTLKQIPEVNNTYYPYMNQRTHYKINNKE
jgi:hypothetical protein